MDKFLAVLIINTLITILTAIAILIYVYKNFYHKFKPPHNNRSIPKIIDDNNFHICNDDDDDDGNDLILNINDENNVFGDDDDDNDFMVTKMMKNLMIVNGNVDDR